MPGLSTAQWFPFIQNQVSPQFPVSAILFSESMVNPTPCYSVRLSLGLPILPVLSDSHSRICHGNLFPCILFTCPNHRNSLSSVFFFYPAFYNPYEFEAPHSWGSEITHKDASQQVGLLWTSDQLVAETSTWQLTQQSKRANIHAPGGIRIRNPSKRSAVDTRLRPLGHWNPLSFQLLLIYSSLRP